MNQKRAVKSSWIPNLVFMGIWILLLLLFWSGLFPADAGIVFGLFSMYLVLPLTGLIVGGIDGFQQCTVFKWFFPIVAGVFNSLCQSFTFNLLNAVTFHKIFQPHFYLHLFQFAAIPALIGMCGGSFYRKAWKRSFQDQE